LTLSLVVCLALIGCGDSGSGSGGAAGSKVTGKLVKAGEPLAFNVEKQLGNVSVVMSPVDKSATGGGGGATKEDGSFEVTGLAPGTYRLSFSQSDGKLMNNKKKFKPGTGSSSPQDLMDRFGGKFSYEKSPITITVTEGQNKDVGTIDVDDPTTFKH
jgi:hypothetical protein